MESLAPFLQGTCTPYNMPVYPGARRLTAESSLCRIFAGRGGPGIPAPTRDGTLVRRTDIGGWDRCPIH